MSEHTFPVDWTQVVAEATKGDARVTVDDWKRYAERLENARACAEHALTVAEEHMADGGPYPCRQCKRYREQLALSADERTAQLATELRAEQLRSKEWRSQVVGLTASRKAQRKRFEEQQRQFEKLCETVSIPAPPCPHGNEAGRCLQCLIVAMRREERSQ